MSVCNTIWVGIFVLDYGFEYCLFAVSDLDCLFPVVKINAPNDKRSSVFTARCLAHHNTHYSGTTEKRVSQWEELMRKFSKQHEEQCKAVSLDIPRVFRSTKYFPTGSNYKGTWNILGMSGYGVYTFPNGVIYEGEFDDGMFHGKGTLRYPNGCKLKGQFHKGVMIERKLIFDDGLEYDQQDWEYCKMPDRRFTIEYKNGLQPAGRSNMTARLPSRKIPPGFYDTGDGFYNPITRCVYKADDLTAILRSPSVREQKWIMEYCRTSEEKVVGPRQDLYEQWLEPQIKLSPVPAPAATTRYQKIPSRNSFHDKDNQDKNYYKSNESKMRDKKHVREITSSESRDLFGLRKQRKARDATVLKSKKQDEKDEMNGVEQDTKHDKILSFENFYDVASLTSYEMKKQNSSRIGGIASSVLKFTDVEHGEEVITMSKKSKRFNKNLKSLHPDSKVPFDHVVI